MKQYSPVLCLALMLPLSGCGDSTDAPTEEPTSTTEDTSETTEEETVDRTGQVLRHAVFFSFKEESSDQDVQGVVDAFRELPSKIDAIIDFQWGKNNSSEDKDDGFTHCFLLTFRDDAGRKEYLPHPDHKAFGDVLRPHMEDVFVVDWWGDAEPAMKDGMLHHFVFFKFQDDAASEGVTAVEEAFAALPEKIEEISRFEWGTNNSPETHDDGFTHAFLVTFDDEAGREAYLPHPDHMAFVEVLKPVLDKVRVLDFTAQK